MIALVAALLLQDAYAGIAQVVTPPPPPPPGFYPTREEALAHDEMGPAFDHVEIGEWTYQTNGSDDNFVMLTRPGRVRGQIWVRYENAVDTDENVLSERSLIEVVCSTGQVRKLQTDLFALPNLRNLTLSVTTPSGWSYAAPDTVAGLQLELACGE